jgi:hypothetical protein
LERAVDRLEDSRILNQLLSSSSGFGLRLGGLPTGGGFAIGPAYTRPELVKENLRFRVSAAGSFAGFYGVDMTVSLPRLARKRLRADLHAAHNDSPRIPYYGPGAGSRKRARTNFRREDTVVDALVGARLHPEHVTVGITGGLNFINVGPGTDTRFASTDTSFTPQQTPGIDEQTDFFHVGPFLQVDFRDRKNDPHKGTNLLLRFLHMNDRLDRYSFKRGEATLEQYVPFLNQKRVLAFRATTQLSWADAGHRIPFYMQSTLGGSDDLRGFRPYRFYDNNMVLLNGEYRWEVAPALDMALFVDAGKVFSRPGDISLSKLEKAGGLGFRFKNRDGVVVRLDAGVSNEGVQLWFKFSPPFVGAFHNLF